MKKWIALLPFLLLLLEEAVVYEVLATWLEEEVSAGTACYSFCTAVPEIIVAPVGE